MVGGGRGEIDPANPPDEEQARERARDKRLEVDPPSDPVEAEVVRQWLDGDFDLSQTRQMNELVDAIDAKEQQNKTGTNGDNSTG